MTDRTPYRPTKIELFAVPGIPLIAKGDDLALRIGEALAAANLALERGDILIVAQKIVSKAEGRTTPLASVEPSDEALALAEEVNKDPRLVHLILSESRRIVRKRRDVLIVEHRSGHIMANAGVDQSNVGGEDAALLLPKDADASAETLRAALSKRTGCEVAVIVSDSFGRPWRQGTAGVAIGCAGLPALHDLRGTPDLFGRKLEVTEVGLADEIASAASLVMGQAAEGNPVVVLRGLPPYRESRPAAALIRPAKLDLFR